MRILVTGALGNVGRAVLDKIYDSGHQSVALDIKNRINKKRARFVKNNTEEIIFADILDKKSLFKALEGCDCVIHLAAIVPPLSEKNPDLTAKINTDGTKLLVDSLKETGKMIPVVYASSASVMGHTQDSEPPVNTSKSANPGTIYEKTKYDAEAVIAASGLRFCILRLASVLDSGSDYSDDMLELLFEFPLESRNEVILDSDAAAAIVNAALNLCNENTVNEKILFIGGGEKNGCRLKNMTFISNLFDAMGIGMLSEHCFSTDTDSFHMDWYDTEESQALLEYQSHSFDDFLEIIKKRTEAGGLVLKTMAPRLRKMMQMQSPYYKKYIKENKDGN